MKLSDCDNRGQSELLYPPGYLETKEKFISPVFFIRKVLRATVFQGYSSSLIKTLEARARTVDTCGMNSWASASWPAEQMKDELRKH